ncbi:MAG: hypothetical protein RL148_269 [Planctomycetota bacterium]
MPPRQSPSASRLQRHRASGWGPRPCGAARWLLCAGLLAVLAPAQGIAPDAFAGAARKLLADPSPRVRGEAALVVATARHPADLEAVRRVAGETDPAASHRGLVALGLLAVPSTSPALVTLLPQPGERVDDRAVVAAFALALLPDDDGSAEIARVLVRTRQGSFRRQQPLLHAVTLGTSLRTGTMHAGALEQMLHDESLKDPIVRSLLLASLARIEGMPADADLRTGLASPETAERTAALRVLLQRQGGTAWWELTARLAARDPDAQVRALALAHLTATRHPRALETARAALRSAAQEECAQAVRTLLALGGGSMRALAESTVLDAGTPARTTAMLLAWRGAPSQDMASWCRATALDGRQPVGLRAACALAALDVVGTELLPALTDGLVDCDEPEVRDAAARALRLRTDGRPVEELAPADAMHAERTGRVLGSLLRAGHVQAAQHAVRLLEDPQAGPALRAAVLTGVRAALVPWLQAPQGPEPLRAALAR